MENKEEKERGLIKFDRTSAADQAAKKMAEKAATKAAVASGKFAGKLAWHIIALLISFLGLPIFLALLAVIVFMLILPSNVFSSVNGLDSKYMATDMDPEVSAQMVQWENNAEAEIAARRNQLVSVTFWDDMNNFFASGHWGTAGNSFETEFVKAQDKDGSNGTSPFPDAYFGASNRVVALINESFRSSLRDSIQGGVFKPNLPIRKAKHQAKLKEAEYVANAENHIPRAGADEYIVSFDLERDREIEKQQFVYESCYVLAAGSFVTNKTEDYANSVKTVLDIAFDITGLNDGPQEICWNPEVYPRYTSYDEQYEKERVYRDEYVGYDKSGKILFRSDRNLKQLYPEHYKKVTEVTKSEVLDHIVMGIRRHVTVTAVYTVSLKPDYKDIVDRRCGITATLDPNDPKWMQVTDKDMVVLNANEIAKFYHAGEFLDMGDFALPLEPGTYRISSRFERRYIPELGIYGKLHEAWDLAAAHGNPIFAVIEGIVQVGWDANGYGNYVTITHPDGTKTRYAHMSSVAVQSGQTVAKGEVIGYVGTTGSSTGNHLHFEIHNQAGVKIDPANTEIGIAIEQNQRS